jgi:glycosyltransferase involved in cell wall biosynthesis
MNNETIFTIITPAFNQGKFIGQAMQSVLEQAGDFYIDYIVLDGGSTDDSVEIIRRHERILKEHFEQKEIDGLTYYIPTLGSPYRCKGLSFRWHSGPDGGQTAAINTGIDLGKGNILAYLNSDDVYEPYAFQAVLDAFTQVVDGVSAEVVYGNATFIDAEGNTIGAYPVRDITTADLGQQNHLSQPSVFIKMDTVRRVGSFNAKISNSMDYEYWMRLWKQGTKFKFIPAVLSSTRIHGDSKTNRNQMRIKLECLAIVEHYTGTIPTSWKVAFAQDASFLGILSSKVLSGFNKLRSIFIRIYAPIYFFFKRSKVKGEKRRLFR